MIGPETAHGYGVLVTLLDIHMFKISLFRWQQHAPSSHHKKRRAPLAPEAGCPQDYGMVVQWTDAPHLRLAGPKIELIADSFRW
jgi:hypothetical protein